MSKETSSKKASQKEASVPHFSMQKIYLKKSNRRTNKKNATLI
jgi:hypothetical protein